MRIGTNPEKEKNDKNILKPHRVIIVFYIPDSKEEYFKELDVVLDKCLESLIKTINFETTNITLINNKSSSKIDKIVDKYLSFIDKYIIYSENKGKVYAIINEVRGVFEPFVTISDADVLFFNGWEKAVFQIYKNFKKMGVYNPIILHKIAIKLASSSIKTWNSVYNPIKINRYRLYINPYQYLKNK